MNNPRYLIKYFTLITSKHYNTIKGLNQCKNFQQRKVHNYIDLYKKARELNPIALLINKRAIGFNSQAFISVIE